MHLLIIAALLCLLFPTFRRLLGGFFKAILWVIVVGLGIGLIAALHH
jgi:hypothetical protein